MSGRVDVLVEIGCEEIPDRFMEDALAEIGRRWEAVLAEEGLPPASVSTCGTPRRLTVTLRGVPDRQADRTEELLGPPVSAAFDGEGQPTKAALGFARKCGLPVEELGRADTPKGERVRAVLEVPGRSAKEVVADRAPELYASLPWPKNMRWGDGTHQWVRPVHWIVALAGSEIVDFELFGVRSGRTSRGHRTLAGGPVEIVSVDGYASALHGARVIVDREERRLIIERGLREHAAAVGGRPVDDPGLVGLTADLVEWPVVVTGRFPAEYLELPDVVVRTAMRDHQRFFAVLDDDGALLPAFLHVAGQDNPDGTVAANNAGVLVARLDDARFFWRKDLQTSLADRAPELQRVLYQEQLGSYADKVQRLRRLAEKVASLPAAAAADRRALLRAVDLCKVDLTTDMVKEFTSLQGVMGGLYLRREGTEAEATCAAIEEHHRPGFSGDELPASPEGALLSVIDRVDTLVGCFGVGLIPSGSKDPFALRRAAQGLVAVLAGRELALEIDTLVEAAAAGLHDVDGFSAERVSEHLRPYLHDRIRHVLGQQHAADDVEAALGSRWVDLPGLVKRAAALAAVRSAERSGDFEALSVAFKRVRNIVRDQPVAAPAVERLAEPAEKALAERFDDLAPQVRVLVATGEFLPALETLASLRPQVDRFFDEVFVMVDDEAVRRNRLALLKQVEILFLDVADISQIVVAGDD